MKKYFLALAVIALVGTSCKKTSSSTSSSNNNSTSSGGGAAKAFLNLTFSPTNAWFSTNGTMTAPVDSTTAKTITSKIDITYIYNYGYSEPGFFDPVARSQSWYWTDYYEPWLSTAVVTRYYTTNLTQSQFTAAQSDQSKIATYFADTAHTKIAPHYIFPTGSCIGGRQSYGSGPASPLLAMGVVFGFKNTVTGKRGLMFIRNDQSTGWPNGIIDFNTKVDIIREN